MKTDEEMLNALLRKPRFWLAIGFALGGIALVSIVWFLALIWFGR